MVTTLVYKLTGKCEDYMKNEKLSELQQLICPASRKEAVPCRYQLHAICDKTADDVSTTAGRTLGNDTFTADYTSDSRP